MISRWVLRPFQHKQELSSVYQFIDVLYNLRWVLSSSDNELTLRVPALHSRPELFLPQATLVTILQNACATLVD